MGIMVESFLAFCSETGRMTWSRAAQQRKGEAVGDHGQRSYPESAVDRSKDRSFDQQWQSSS